MVYMMRSVYTPYVCMSICLSARMCVCMYVLVLQKILSYLETSPDASSASDKSVLVLRVRMYVYLALGLRTNIHRHTYILAGSHSNILSIHPSINPSIHLSMYLSVFLYACMYRHIYIYVYITYTHVYTCMYVCM